ncbi:NAD(P)H-binding protein [Niabella hibiscisoli]|uniref:NAD(P)H-binding protein n=1 Tax=Niabella hibiscisoli TaxID=1825928 RepID=UPI001F0D9DA8|nr:NAD(P)H-binding protein [Niabella hibiscisoli]MCH5715628.1 NAD(P)H-binding protein [Niabella hibiscisoli]
MKAVLIGATGATGKELLQVLLRDESITEVIALVRKPLSLHHAKLQVQVINFDNPRQWQDLVRGDMAFSCLGTTLKAAGSKEAQYKVDYEYQLAFARAASLNAVPAFVLVSAGMANPKSLVFYSRMKGELEQAILALSFESLTLLRPGLLSRPGTDRAGEKISESVLHFFNKLGLLKKLEPLPVHKLAMLMLHYGRQKHRGVQVIESKQILSKVKLLS